MRIEILLVCFSNPALKAQQDKNIYRSAAKLPFGLEDRQ